MRGTRTPRPSRGGPSFRVIFIVPRGHRQSLSPLSPRHPLGERARVRGVRGLFEAPHPHPDPLPSRERGPFVQGLFVVPRGHRQTLPLSPFGGEGRVRGPIRITPTLSLPALRSGSARGHQSLPLSPFGGEGRVRGTTPHPHPDPRERGPFVQGHIYRAPMEFDSVPLRGDHVASACRGRG